jgi:hypothetical protein
MFLASDVLSSHSWPCPASRAYALIAVQTIFSQITPETTNQQFAAAEAALLALCKRYQAQVAQQGLFHYQAPFSGLHTCVRELYLDLSARLTNLAIMHQQPEKPAPKHQLITSEGAVIDLEGRMKTSGEETNLGTEDTTSS